MSTEYCTSGVSNPKPGPPATTPSMKVKKCVIAGKGDEKFAIPEPAPVTIATLPSIENGTALLPFLAAMLQYYVCPGVN